MFGWSPPNILVTLILCFLIVLQFYRSPTQAKPYQKRDSLGTYTAGTHRGVYKGDWPKIVNFENGEEKERRRRSPTEVDDESQDVTLGRTLSVVAQKRQGIETPIQPLTSDSSMDLQHLNMEENVRSKVNQPQNKSISVDVKTEQENKAAGESGKEDNVSTSQSELNVGNKYEISSSSAENANDPKAKQGIMDSNVALEAHDKADSSKLSVNYDSNSEKETSKGKMEVILVPSRSVDENAHVRSVEESTNNHLGNLPSDKSDKGEDNQPSSESPSITTKQPKAQTTNTVLVDKQHQDSDVNKGTIAKSETSGIISSNEKPVAPNEPSSSQKAHLKNDESKPINSTPQTDTASAEPVRDELGNSGSEIVTTHRRREPEVDSYAERDTEAKPANGPEVGHFQVDDKSADLEINANSAGVKVKAKPASLQVVSRPGSHSSSGAQERSFFSHYHYPPYHLHHHWYPGMRRSYGHLHRHHFFRPYRPFPERRSFESFYDEAPFYRRRLPYWYPHRRRHHFHDSYLYERSRLEEPDDLSRYRRRRRHKRRFRHINRPYRRQFYNNNIPIMNGMDVPPMGVQPEEGTMPQLPIGPVAPYTQRQNIVTPMPPPINVVGNPPPGLLGGVNAAMFGMNGMDNFNGINSMNREFNGMNAMGAFGFNLPDQMGPEEGFSNEITRGLGEIQRPHMTPRIATPISFSNTPVKASRRAFKKTNILSEKANNDTRKERQSHDHKTKAVDKATKDILKTNLDNNFRKTKINIKSWEKTLKHYHSLKTPTSKIQEPHKFRRNTKSAFESTEKKNTGKMITTHLHPQHAKEMEGKRKNEIVMHRPPIIYHPPPEIYHRPDIVVHRAPIMLHRPPIIYHQPPVVVHRPAIIYHQPPIVFHQPPPMVHQPILHSHDTWVAKPVVYHTASTVSHDKTYFGVPSHVYAGNYGAGCHKGVCFYRKGRVPHSKNTNAKNSTLSQKTKRDSLSDYMDYVSSLWKPNEVIKRNIHDDYELITSRDGAKQKLSYKDTSVGNINKRDRNTDDRSSHFKRDSDDLKNTSEKKKKKDVVVNRPPIIYHPPPEIYHRPDIVVHRPPLVIHRPPIIYHQPPVIVHRPAVVYHQPPIVFHQPPPAVSQPLLYSHDSFTVHPTFYATHHGSVVRDFGHYVGVPNVITNYGNPLFGRGPPMGKRSKIEKPPSNKNGTSLESANSTEAASKKNTLKHRDKKAKNESNEKAGKKNTVLVHRPPIIYHPPPEIYHRPVIVVHRPPIMIHRAPIFYHQPPVVVHRPAIVYHQPPLIFHQPPPMVHQPILKSHDTWISHPVVFPYASRVMHHHTYVGVPDAYTVRHYGDHGFYKSHILKHTHHDEGHAFERNKITGEKKHSKNQKEDSPKEQSTSMESENQNTSLSLKTKNVATQKGGKKNTVIVRRPPVIYHPPPEIYHRPEIVVHRAPIVIHRAPIIYHQPPVVVHRPAIVYHEPPLIFHQPPPVVHQRIYKSHDAYIRRPVMKLFSSRMHRAGHLYHIPHAYYHGRGGAIHFMAFGKSKVPQKEHFHEEKGDTRTTVNESKTSKTQRRSHHKHRKHSTLTRSKDKTETGTKLHHNYKFLYHKAEEVTEKAHKKNSVVIHRPPIIYHPPPEIYHRPDIVVHRAPIVLYRAPIIYHQPPVVVHRPAIVYHQPAIVFHQPPPMVNQPVLHSHDTWVSKAVVIPYGSRVRHIATYRGVPHEGIFMHGFGTGAFGKSRVPIRGSRRNEIHGINVKGSNGTSETKTEESKESREQSDKERNRLTRVSRLGKKRKEYKTIHAAAIMKKTLPNRPSPEYIKNLVGTRARSPRSLQKLIGGFNHPVSSAAFLRDLNNVKSDVGASAEMRIQSAIRDHQGPIGANVRIQRGIAETWNKFEGENPYQMFKRNSEESDDKSTSDENEGKNTNSTKKTILIIHRPPILYHPPSHMIHRPSIVVHRPDIIVHRHPIVLHRPPILVHRPPIIIHRRPILIHRTPIIVHRPPLVFHRPPIIIHRRPYIIHHHPIMIHRAPIVIHKGPQMLIHHSHLIHHYPMHMIHMHCPGCGFGKSTVARLEVKRTHRKNDNTSLSDRLHKDSTVMDSHWKGSNLPKRSVAETKPERSSTEEGKHKNSRRDKHKKKKDVVVNRPPIIYHPPPEVYHRPDIVVHRAPILIHRPPIVYHQPPVVVHRPAVVYHQPPIVFHQPAPAVNQPLLFSHDSFVVHPMAFASHMGSVVNDAGRYIGLPHGGVTNYPGSIPHGITGHVFPSLNPHSWSRRAEVSKPKQKKNEKVTHEKHDKLKRGSAQINDNKNGKGLQTSSWQKSKQTKGERKNKVVVARPAMIYHPPPEIYDRPDIIVHRPDIVIHQPSVVYHQSSVVVHRAPVIYQQPPVVFHQPAPMITQPVYHAHDTYIAQHVYHPHESHISHSATYVGAPHYYPGHNSYGWGLPGNEPNAHVHPAAQFPEYGYLNSPAYPTQYLVPRAYVRSKVENAKKKFKHKDAKSKNGHMIIRRRSAVLSKHHRHRHHHHYHHDHDHHHDDHHHRVITDYDPHPVTSIAHIGHRKHTIIIHRPPLIYYPPPRVYNQPDIVMHQPLLVYHKPSIVLDQPPTVVHHPKIVYHQPSVVFHDPQPIVHTPVINTPLLVKSHMERVNTKIVSSKPVSGKDSDLKGAEKPKSDEKRDLSNPPQRKKRKERNGSKKQNVVVHRPPIVYHPPPNIFHKPPVVMHQPPTVVYRPPILIHRAPVVVQSPPMVIHRPPIVLYQPEPTYHTTWGYAFGKSKLEGENNKQSKAKHSDKKQGEKKSRTKGTRRSKSTKADRKNMVLVHRPAMIYHPPPEIYDRPDVIVHRPDIVIHRPSIVYHQPSVVVHRSPIIYRQPPVVFHQPSPMVHQPVMHAHDMYVAHAVPVPHTSHLHHTATYVGAPHFFNEPHINGYFGHAFAKSKVTKISNNDSNDVNNTRTTSTILSEDERHFPLTPGAPSKDLGRKKSKPGLKGHLKAGKKNQVIINRPALIYHPPPEIYDRPNVIVHRPDIVVHRPSIVFHQPSVVVHRPPIIYQAPSVVFHQPPPLVNQPIMHSYDTYVAHAVPVPYSSHIQHTSTYVGSPHHYPGAWNYGWSQPHAHDFAWDQFNPFGLAYGKSNIPSNEAKVSHHRKSGRKDKIRRTLKDQSKREKKKDKTLSNSRKKNQVVFQRPPLIYHPPPEVYHKPDVIVHRPDVVIHRPAVVYHQPSVVIHRPPVIYHQPPVVFHQPAPSVSQPILHSHDTYVNHPYFTQASSSLYHIGNYIGSPHFYSGGLGEHGYGTAHAFGKSEVQMSQKKGNHHKNMNIQRKGLGTTPGKDTKDLDDKPKFKKRSKKVTYGIKKNLVVMRRPPLIYHPPPEIYHKPDVVVHRPDLVIHRPSVVFHQPSVVVHRPPVIYRQPPVIFHQPSPMVQQPILHSHDTYLASTHFDPFIAHVYHTGSYVGAPHYYPGGWGHGYGAHKAFGKSKVEKRAKKQKKIESHGDKNENYRGKNKRSVPMEKYSFDLKKRKHKKKDASRGDKKNVVIIRRPPLVYHPPPEIYHKPVVIVHRPDIVLHRPSVVFHQPSVVVHRAPVIYRQPPVVFHQPSPMVNQPIYHSHETYLAHHHFVPYLSHLTHAGSYVGVPHFFPGHQSMGHFFGHAYGKSKVEPSLKTSQGKSESLGDKNNNYRGKNKRSLSMEKDSSESKKRKLKIKAASGGDKKNVVIIRRPPLVYHPPPEIYHKPVVIVHRPDIVLHRPSVVFHQPSVVVHRAPVIYRQPPVVFHQPSPMVNQPIYHSHETYLAHHRFVPYLSHLTHAGSYVGVPHFFPGHQSMGHFFGHAYGKSKVEPSLKTSQGKSESLGDKNNNYRGKNKRSLSMEKDSSESKKRKLKIKAASGGDKKNVVIIRRPPLVYHPPPEIYHKPVVIVHRPDIVLHRPSVVFHQPSVVVHRAPVIYRQPPVVFHQPSPMVNQPIYHSHETYLAHHRFVPYLSHLTHAGSYVGVPHFFPGHQSMGHFFGHAYGKSKVEPSLKTSQGKTTKPSKKSEGTEKQAAMHEDLYRKLRKQVKKTKSGKGRKKTVQLHPEKENKKDHHRVHRKNLVLVQRPALIYHPPPEIYARPNIIVHRPDVVIHRPSVVYHQPSVVVHRPPIIYHQPPVIFHQPAPMVKQPIYTSHDIYQSHPQFVPYVSHINHAETYVGAPHYFPGEWKYGYGFSDSFVPRDVGFHQWNGFTSPMSQLSPYRADYFLSNSLGKPSGVRSRQGTAFAKSDVQKYHEKAKDIRNNTVIRSKYNERKKSKESDKKDRKRSRRSAHLPKSLRKRVNETRKVSKKNMVIIRRPPLVYHPPPEVYHKPDVIVHRPDVVIHRPSVVYHQPSVVVHRPPIIYNEPPVIFHQPAPMVNQAIFHSHEHYIAHPSFVPFTSHLYHTSTYVGAPELLHAQGTSLYGHAIGKSDVAKNKSKTRNANHKTENKNKIRRLAKEKSTKSEVFHPQKEKDEKASRKNDIVVSRPPIIYHPPPEIYHRPDIVVHRAPIVLHRPPIIYHQPPVVVHRPAVVYHQPPVVFHQPPPTVHQPILHSHDSFVVHPNAKFFPQGSTLTHSMNYVGIPNHVLHTDDTAFHVFHRSNIEYSDKETSHKTTQKRKTPVPKSTISKIPTTNKENTQTTITDQTQKKTLRSIIRRHRLNKRQLIGSHSLFGSFSPINNIDNSRTSVEQNHKLSTIPGDVSNLEKNTAKRQLILQEPTENVLHNTLPPVYDTLEMAALQNQALRATEDLQELNSANRVTLPFSGNSLERAAIRQYPVPLQSYLQSTPKHYSPDVRVHVETTRSSIPRNSRNKRQIVPLYQQQYTTQMHPLVLQAPNTQNTEDTTSAFSSSSLYHLFSPYHLAYHQLTNPYHYLGINAVQHHPRVNINVQSARSTIPKGDHFIQKRSEEKKSKRQFLAVMSPLSPKMPFGLRSGMMPLPISPYYSLQRYPLPLVPSLDDSEESEMEEPTFPETLPIFRGQSQDIFNPYNALQDDENYSPSINFMASYLRSLYNSYLGYPPNQHGRKPKVDIEVHATKSDIPKVTEDTKYFHARIAKRQMSDFLPNSRLISNHHNLSAANGPKSYHHSSLHVSNSVETAKKHDMIAVIKERRFPEARKRKQFQQTRTGDKRDELLQNSENGQGISPYQGNANFMATQANEFVGTSESSPLQNDIDPGNNEGIQTPSQQQDVLETDGQQQEAQSQEQLQEQEQDQQQSPTQQPPNIPDQPTIEPFQQQLVLPAPLAPIQLPIQPPLQPAFNLPLVAPVQSDAQGALPGISRAKSTEQSSSQQGSDADEWQPKHTTIDIKVGAKSIVPQTSTKTKKSSLQEYFPQTMDEKKDNQRRERISLLTRFPAMQVLPQTFKQNGVMMPPFNTLPVNHRVKSNGMLLEELQKQKKYQILRAKMNKGHKKLKENAKKREFFAIPQSTLPAQPYLFPAQAKAQSRPKVSVTVKVNHRKSTFPTEKYLSQQKGESGLHDQNEKPKRQVYGMEPYTNPFLKSPQVPQVQMNAQQPKVSIQVEAEKKRTIRQQGNKGNQSTKERRQIYGLSELPQGGIMQPVSLTSQTRPLGYFPTSLHTPRVSINVVTSKRSKEDFHDIHKRQMLGFQSDVVETMGGHQETIPPSQAPFMDNEVAEYNTAQTPDNVQTQSSEDEASQTTIQSNPAILQQQQVPVLSSNENDFNERPRVTVHVEASKRDSKANKEGHHISPGLSKGKVSEHREGANGYGPPKKLKRQLFGTVPLFSSLDQTGISADLQDGSNARSSVPISAGNTGYTSHRIQKRQFYNYLGGQQEGTLSDQAIKDTNEAQQQQQQGIPIGVFQQEPGLQTEVPQMNPQQGSLLPENNQYQNQIDLPENNQLKGLFGPLSTLNRPRVSINVQTTKSQVPITVATKRNTPEKEVSKTLDKESKKFKRQFEIIGGGGVIERRRGSKLLTSPSLKKGRGGNLLGFGTNLNKPVEVFADPITNLVAGGLPARKRPRLGGIRIDSPPGLGTIPLKGSVNPIEGTLAPGQGVPSIIQDNAAEEIAPFVQDAATTSSNPLLPPNGIAAPAVESLGKENIADMPLPDTPAERTEIVPVSNLNQALVQNFPLESASAPLPERQVLLTPQVLPMAPIVPLAPPMLVPPAATMQSLTATDQNGPENLNSPLLRPVFPPIFPMAPPIAAPPSPPPSPTGVLPESEEDKPSVHVNVETARSHVPRVKHSKAKTSDQAGRG